MGGRNSRTVCIETAFRLNAGKRGPPSVGARRRNEGIRERTLLRRFDGDWKISADGENPRRTGAGSTRSMDAVGLAHLDVRTGREVEVIVQDTDSSPGWDSARTRNSIGCRRPANSQS